MIGPTLQNLRPTADLVHRVLSVPRVATYALELFDNVSGLDAVHVAIGMGSGVCGLVFARNALGLNTEIIGACPRCARPVPLLELLEFLLYYYLLGISRNDAAILSNSSLNLSAFDSKLQQSTR
jgi:hypothetical protein